MMSCAREEMLPELKEIWMEAFGDKEEYIDFFFSHKLEGKESFTNQIVWMEMGKPVSMLTVLSGKLILENGMKIDFWYIYAVATKKEWRRRGIAGALIENVYHEAKKRNTIIGLVPASTALFHYYEKLSFQTLFYMRILKLYIQKIKMDCNFVISYMSSEVYYDIRNRQLSGNGSVMWDRKAISYAMMENEKSGGSCYCVFYKKEQYVVLCNVYGKCLYVKEITVPESILEEVINRIASFKACDCAEIRLSPMLYQCGELKAFGMIRGEANFLNHERGYLGLALD